MQEWNEGISHWYSNKLRVRFRNKFGRSLGAKRKTRLILRKTRNFNKRRLRYSSRKINTEWAEGISQKMWQMHLTRAKKKLMQKSELFFENIEGEWSYGFDYWRNYKLSNSSWKWIKPNRVQRSHQSALKIALKKQLIRKLLNHRKLQNGLFLSKSEDSKSDANPRNLKLIHVYKKGVNFGPYYPVELQRLIDCGEFESSDLGFHEGSKYWTPLSCVEGLFFKKKISKEKKVSSEIKYGEFEYPIYDKDTSYFWIIFSISLSIIIIFLLFYSWGNKSHEILSYTEFQSRESDKKEFN
ncbi:hypothetical protein N9N13_08525, partial [Opitutales bacterium]|nr:hypothetical protein [Opitutales bacterium]